MKILKRAGVGKFIRIEKTKSESKAYSAKKKRFEKEMTIVRADSISKSFRSSLSASKIVLNG
ncbi:MAG: hypothetical protein LBR10_12445 [Prevotellaceae bacterium]|jgi:hypothetical protein|nr:hypothetical protein [Prevotellaceae bacterium]